jgi:hypothetical protein
VGLIVNEVLKNLGISLKGEKIVFNFLSDEDLKNLYAFFESKHIPKGETLLFYLNHSPIHIFFLTISIPLIFDGDKSKRQKREMHL